MYIHFYILCIQHHLFFFVILSVSVCVCVGMHAWVYVCVWNKNRKLCSVLLLGICETLCIYNNGTKLKWTCFQKAGNIRVPFRWNIKNLQMWGIQFVKWYFEKGLYYLPQSGQISDNGMFKFNKGWSWFLSGRNWPGGKGSPVLDHLDLTISSCKSYNALLH